ncbi:leucyl aminopeptidase [Thiomicrorhabdus sp.]|uniref:leucyl aminopeptidase n=1 Tax=Thiomicrorhabdus sp. TaxID=2039724 RepID=UPI0029C89CCC|nr:leucyl aminopeptidase [Thiomicrorhabdus sp.]
MKPIQFQFQTDLPNIDTLLVPVNQEGQVSEALSSLPFFSALQKLTTELFENGDFSGKTAKAQLLITPSDIAVRRLILIGIGDTLTTKNYLSCLKSAATTLDHCGALSVLNALALVYPAERDQSWALMQNAQAFQRSFYDYSHESRGEHTPKEPTLSSMSFPCDADNASVQQGQATAFGMALTQDLANMPSNFCTPSYLAETAQQLADEYGFGIEVLERDEMTAMGMGSFMAVAQGTKTPPKMISLRYQGAGDSAPVALVGKGVTFDTGGISLKPGAAMDEMKYDMSGAATVLGVFKALGELKPAINVVGVIPATENMPSGNAIKPGDVVTSLSGQTIEILNTDAEGRLILCDALTYAQQKYQPEKVINMATLTGACIIALGHHVSGLMANNQELAEAILKSGQNTYDRFWQLPLGEEWDEQLKSNFADMANIGGRSAGTITAGQFLARYTKDVPWAHLDIAGTAWVSGDNKGATGRPVPALVDFLMTQI